MTDVFLGAAFAAVAFALALLLARHIRRYDRIRQVDARDRAGDLANLQLAGLKIRRILDGKES